MRGAKPLLTQDKFVSQPDFANKITFKFDLSGGGDHEASAGVVCSRAAYGIGCIRFRQEKRHPGWRPRESVRRLAGHSSWVENHTSLSLRGAGCLRQRILRLRSLDRSAEDGLSLPIRRLSIATNQGTHTPEVNSDRYKISAGAPCARAGSKQRFSRRALCRGRHSWRGSPASAAISRCALSGAST